MATADSEHLLMRVPRRLDVTNAKEMQDLVETHYQETSKLLVLDFTDCIFIDSSGLALLIHSAKLARESCKGFRLIHMNKHSQELIKISHLDRFLPVYDTLEDALLA